MEFDIVNKSRRSIRKYKQQEVKKEDIEAIIKAAQYAPTWKNSQTGRYYVITNKQLLNTFRQEVFAPYNAENTKDAPVLIVTTFIKDRSGFNLDGTPSNELGNGWGCYDLGLQTQSLLLKATDLGLSTLVMGIRDEQKIHQLLNIDENEIVVSVISLGYKDIEPTMPKRKGLEEIVHYFD